ncbi:hypothetical protein [Actinophytocola oryzae]|uniref:Uncharacterized protein n=1 Tax=Actinophytocola oryzae TaxID=502181 RepID=A0A4R7W1U1_9PSEU|nr:hypothetical protein [Actinophytocola oryzae]TDV56553.1 hypothetical protein CLV71_102620 [Actinophytocola oryzae]
MNGSALTDEHWFPDGTYVFVAGGRYDGDHGRVVSRAPDLRPGSAWVNFSLSGTHLVPTSRLVACDLERECEHSR